jgi:hypothetical protein
VRSIDKPVDVILAVQGRQELEDFVFRPTVVLPRVVFGYLVPRRDIGEGIPIEKVFDENSRQAELGLTPGTPVCSRSRKLSPA